ncbi:MAG TPA: HD domain-containing protein [Vicinamibacterales bacterium]
MSNSESLEPRDIATRSIAGMLVPDTPLIYQAIEYARQHTEPYLFNHVMRSWLFAVSIAKQRNVAHDAEVLAVATLLHDVGLAQDFSSGPLRFEVEGANVARRFAQGEGVNERRAQLIWDGVALNSTPSIGLYKEIEVSLCTAGIGLDWGGFGYGSLSASRIAEVVKAFPRLDMKQLFAQAVCRVVHTRPTTTYDNFAADFGERFVAGYKRPSTVDLLMNAPFAE